MTLDIDHLRGWIGREENAREELTAAHVARFNATLDRDGAIDARAEGQGDAAPPLIHLCLCQPAVPTAELGPDGHPARGGFLPPVPLPRRMWAGGAFEFHAPIRVGEEVTRRSVVEDVQMKEGRSGTLCFVTVRHHIESGGRAALTERQDIVYRDAGPAGGKPAGEAAAETGANRGTVAPHPAERRRLRPGAALLFRYSALTFNGHRIHYDQPYTTGAEGYPGLIVHGPLQATMLVHLAQEMLGAAPARFSFRSLSPLFDTTEMALHAETDGEGALRLWTARPGGPVAMEARAEW